MKNTKRSLGISVVALLLCFSMLLGVSYAWFYDVASSKSNIIKSGELDVQMYWSDELLAADSNGWQDADGVPIFTHENWEPGYTDVKYVKIKNAGNLAFQWRLGILAEGRVTELADVIDVYYVNPVSETVSSLEGRSSAGVLSSVIERNVFTSGVLLPATETGAEYTAGETILAIAFHMQEGAGNEYKKTSLGAGFAVSLIATQFSYENDSFGSDYDKESQWPDNVVFGGASASANITTNDNKTVGQTSLISENGTISALVPEGVAVNSNTDRLTLTVSDVSESNANITLDETEAALSIDVHINGVAPENTVVMSVSVKELLPVGLNMGNYRFYHVENGETVEMHLLTDGATPVHNNYEYDPATGDVVLYLKSFSEVALVADTEKAWEGNFDYTWYDASKTELTVANADQLAAFSAIVGGMNGQTKDGFSGKTVKLLADINLGDKESENNPDLIFYPIGYYNSTGSYEKTSGGSVTSSVSSFEGTFDGNGNTIKNFYQNTWEMFGDYNDGYSGTPNHYKDAMGLFGYVLNGTVKNLTVSNFSSDGEYTPTGVIAAYADGNSTFENIAITNCNPRVYNTGNGGIVGIAGDTSAANDDHITLKNITVDNSNKISALWGSWDVACGGLVGMYRGNVDGSGNATGDTISFENCHVSAIIDVYNDVCANYQYYAYRYSGMIIGSVRHNTKNAEGKTIPNMTGISATGCTVNYGDWNDYYYCEFEKNTMASYSEDYQFSRVPHSELNFTDSNGNGVVDADERASVTGCTHTHTAEENHQAIYLPFHQLFTGYSWGVSSIGLKEYSGIVTDLGIEEDDIQESVVKFEGKVNELVNNTTIKLGDIFKFVDNGVDLFPGALTVTITNLDENGNVVAEFVRNTDDWTNSTIVFTGAGRITITIQDYYFCTPTTITVTIKERQPVEKFETKFTGDFLYRVGNDNNITLGTLFSAKSEATIGEVSVHFENISGNATANAFTATQTDWTKETIQFNGTGVIKVTITDDDYCIPNELILEVVDATNVAENGKIGNYNTTSVLLGNTSISTLYLNGGATLYGNGFTIDCTNSPTSGTGNVSENYIIGLAGANLDNVKVIGKVYTEYGAMASSNYNRALIISTGNSTITNCYLSNTAAPVRINSGSLTITGSTLKGGNFANIDVRSGHLTLDNVTTINQALGNDKADDGSTVIGLGIVVYYEMVNTSATSITVKNGLKQYNAISYNDEFSNEYANQFVNGMFNSSNSSLQYTSGNVKWVNTGIILMTGGVDVTGAGNKSDVSFMGATGAVYTTIPTAASVEEKPAEYATLGQGVLIPSASFDHDNEVKGNYIPKEADKNDYCYFDGEQILISMDQGDTFQYDPFILNATKLGNALNYTVKLNGNPVASGSKISFNTAGEYTITYTYEDTYNYRLDSDGNLESFTVTYTKTEIVSVAIVEKAAEHAKFTFATNSTGTEEILYNNNTYISANGVTADGTNWGKITVGDKTIVYPIVTANVNKTASKECQVFYYVFNKVISITDANGIVYSHANGTGTDGKMPSNLKVVKGNELKVENNVFSSYNDTNLTRTGGKIFCYSSSSQEDSPEKFNNSLAFKSPSGLGFSSSTRNYDAAVIVQYQFTDSNNATYYYYVGYKITNPNTACPSGDGTDNSSCITPDTLITLANGTQVRVDSLTGNEELLVWNMETGMLDKAPIMFVDSDAEAEYEIIKLKFSDGTEVKVIYEHGFWDYDLNKYVYLDRNAADYIGHTFAKQNGDALEKVQLVDVVIETETTTAWSPVTAGHLCYFVNGMLSMPGGIRGLFNIFEVDADTMTYDYEQMAKDIETYGLFTYEELNELCPLSEDMFNAAGGAYLKISIGKGNLTEEELYAMINRYSKFFN